MDKTREQQKISIWTYLSSEVTRGYVLEADEERYTTRRQKIYTFMKIPRELEKFMSYGFFHCLDSFLFLFTFLPIRFLLAAIALVVRTPLIMLGIKRPFRGHVLYPAEIIDLLKGFIIAICVYIMHIYIDTSMMYHLIKSQSVIKLYLFYNMLEVGDRLFSAFGQDTIDALFWTATEPKDSKRQHVGLVPHFLLTVTYVILHSLLVLLQATTLNVAVNASNKALLTIMMSNNFVEIKGSVFKKFDKNNLFQVSCSDVRERFHLFALLLVVIVQTMKEYGWKEQSFWDLAPDCLWVLASEFFVDWVKHAFITRFNEIPSEVYKDYTTNLAYDLAQTKQKHAFSDHSDIVSRRMGFIPLPLSVVIIRVIGMAVKGDSAGNTFIFILGYLCLVSLRILCSIVILGKACDLIDQHQQNSRSASISSSNQIGIKTTETVHKTSSLLTLSKKSENQDNINVKTPAKIPSMLSSNRDNITQFAQNFVNESIQTQKKRYDSTCKIPSPNYLSGTATPKTEKSKETTNKELKESAILLENKIEALFGKNKTVNQDNPKDNITHNSVGTSDGILFATEYVDGKSEASCQKEIKLEEQSLLQNVSVSSAASSEPSIYSVLPDQRLNVHKDSKHIDFDMSELKHNDNVNLDIKSMVEKEMDFAIHSTPFKTEGKIKLENVNSNIVSSKKITGVKTKENEHVGWSKRRSQLLAAKEAATDSRRRPLSCTPPSTSIDQSSVDEEDDSLSISIHTTSHTSSITSNTTNTSGSGKGGNNTPSKLLLDHYSISRTPSSSFEGIVSLHTEEENISYDHEYCIDHTKILRGNEQSKPGNVLSQIDTSLDAITEKENDDSDLPDLSAKSQELDQSSSLGLPDICHQEQTNQSKSTLNLSSELTLDSPVKEEISQQKQFVTDEH